MTTILGISAFYHDSAAALVVDGEIVAAAQEERFTRTKHDPAFPIHAVEYCLQEAGLAVADLDYVSYYDKPFLTFERMLETFLSVAPKGFRPFLNGVPTWLKQKLHIPREVKKQLKGEYKKRVLFTQHHESHAASAFFPSPYDEAAILTVDGVGEWATATIGVGEGNRITLTHELSFPHSLGLLYSAFTYYCGFKVNSGEYKLMGLAPYGEPVYADVIREKLLDIKDDGSFRLDQSYFNYLTGMTMTGKKFHDLFGGPPRKPESDLTEREMDIAASVQLVTEEIMLKMASHAHKLTGKKKLCLAGGVALNCVANGRILREGPFEDLWIQPAAGDAGGALGTALFVWYQLLNNERKPTPSDAQRGSALGPAFTTRQVTDFLEELGAVYHTFDEEDALCERVAELIAEEKVIGWMQGRMEFGPRALGHRSILGDARSQAMQQQMNQKIKFRESFRPFAPSVLEERAAEFFEFSEEHVSPYMLIVADVHEEKRSNSEAVTDTPKGFDQLRVARSEIPAITHVDNSARLQTVDAQRRSRYHKLLKKFEALTDTPVIVNTSFNIRGEPIVCRPEEAWNCFMATHMDVLVLEDCVLLKEEQPESLRVPTESYMSDFPLD